MHQQINASIHACRIARLSLQPNTSTAQAAWPMPCNVLESATPPYNGACSRACMVCIVRNTLDSTAVRMAQARPARASQPVVLSLPLLCCMNHSIRLPVPDLCTDCAIAHAAVMQPPCLIHSAASQEHMGDDGMFRSSWGLLWPCLFTCLLLGMAAAGVARLLCAVLAATVVR